MTISPPANVKSLGEGECCRVLPPCGGVDWLELSIQVTWQGDELFERFRVDKERAKENGGEVATQFRLAEGAEPWCFNMLGYGRKGHEWILQSGEMSLSIGKWQVPKSRPSVLAKLECEYLWRIGAAQAVENLLGLIEGLGGRVESAKVARADLCLDLLMREEDWSPSWEQHKVCRGRKFSPHKDGEILEGMTFGAGDIVARAYDKAREIEHKSGKTWMHDIWGLARVPEGHRVIRIEFQLRGEILKQLGVKTWEDFQRDMAKVWAYCTQDWLKFQSDADKHHTQQTTLPWWEEVQRAFLGVQGESPSVRTAAITEDVGYQESHFKASLANWFALIYLSEQREPPESIPVAYVARELVRELQRRGFGNRQFAELVKLKVAKYRRRREKVKRASVNSGSDVVDCAPTGEPMEGLEP